MIAKKVLFVHDGPILGNKDQTVFYGVHYNDEIIKRYSFFGDTVSFLMRYQEIKDSEAMRYSKITHPSFNFIDLPNFKSIRTYHKKSKSIKIIKEAVDSHDVIILRLPSAAGTIAFEYAKSINKPILIEMVACVYDALWNYDWRGKLMAKYKMKKYQDILQRSSHVIYVTNAFLQGRYPTKGKAIGCSDVVLRDIDTTILDKRLVKIENSSKELVLGTVAAIDVPYKGQADVIKVVAKWGSTEKQYKYQIVGQGNPLRLKGIIDKFKIQSNIEIIGSLSHDKVFEFIDEIDLYIQPSKQEGLPRSVIEAMSRACPIIGSNIAGIPELINKEALFEGGNVDDITTVLEKLSKANMKNWAIENFENAQKFKKETLDDYRECFYNEFKKDFYLD
jgi:glycosyltransferase involved in cell wall biosynthesis